MQLSWQENIICDATISTRPACNTSPHDPVLARLKADVKTTKMCVVKEKTHCIRPKLGITDLEAYRAITKQKLCILSDTCSDLPADVVLNGVHSILLDTSRETTRPRKPPRRKHLGQSKGVQSSPPHLEAEPFT